MAEASLGVEATQLSSHGALQVHTVHLSNTAKVASLPREASYIWLQMEHRETGAKRTLVHLSYKEILQ